MVIADYEVLARIGAGGMGTVYEAVHLPTRRTVAVKVLRPELSSKHELLARFFAEARTASAIKHPGIVEILASGQQPDGTAWLAMELVRGRTLAAVLDQRGRVPPHEAVDLALQMLEALGAAHAAGVVHRDLKPSNLLLDERGRLKLLDFGIAKLLARGEDSTLLTSSSDTLGTPHYMAPEMIEGSEISPATDLYSLGAVLFHLLTGRPVFVGENAIQVMFMHVEATPLAPSSLEPSVPPQLDVLILALLAKRAADRPTAAHARSELEGFFAPKTLPAGLAAIPARPLDDGAPTQTTTAQIATVRPPSRPRSLVAWLSVAALAVIAAVLVALQPSAPIETAVVMPPPPPVKVPDPVVPPLPPVDPPPQPVVPPPPTPVEPPAPPRHVTPPAKAEPTAKYVTSRLSRLRAQLDRYERARRQEDPVQRQFLEQLASDAAAAKTGTERQQVLDEIDELGRQLEKR